jgi:uncharacterized membrane protein
VRINPLKSRSGFFSIAPVLFISYSERAMMFFLTLAGLVLFIVALLTTVLLEVPIVKQIEAWTATTLPVNWQRPRDRWAAFHIIRVVAGIAGLGLFVIAAIFYS